MIDSNTLWALADELENVGPMLKDQYIKVIRLYATEPWRLEPAMKALKKESHNG